MIASLRKSGVRRGIRSRNVNPARRAAHQTSASCARPASGTDSASVSPTRSPNA